MVTNFLKVSLSGLVLAATVNAQAYDLGEEEEGAFQWIQPRNTTILGPYGHSPPVYPSRESLCQQLAAPIDIVARKPDADPSQLMPQVSEDGKPLWPGLKSLSTN